MTSLNLDDTYWDNRYKKKETGWDIGYANSIHIEYVKSNFSKEARILEPGAGSAYEATKLWRAGYTNVFPLDYSSTVKKEFTSKNPEFPAEQYLIGNFFELEGKFDLILEQTFFCALNPSLRESYVAKMHSLLQTGGRLMGVLFSFEKEDGPPFGGSIEEYTALFEKKFKIIRLEKAVNSIPERKGNELFFELLKK
jgi:thiopurine S-methyltransferase